MYAWLLICTPESASAVALPASENGLRLCLLVLAPRVRVSGESPGLSDKANVVRTIFWHCERDCLTISGWTPTAAVGPALAHTSSNKIELAGHSLSWYRLIDAAIASAPVRRRKPKFHHPLSGCYTLYEAFTFSQVGRSHFSLCSRLACDVNEQRKWLRLD